MNPKIRMATEEDIPRIVEMGRSFWELTDYRSVPYDPGSIEHWSRVMISQELLLVAEADGEVIASVGAVCAPLLGNVQFRVASELFWWVEPKYRSHGMGQALLMGIEAAARAQNVTFFNMIALNSVDPEAVAALYLAHGYKLFEWSFVKDLRN